MLRHLLCAAALLGVLSASATAGPNCTCRYKGENYQIGDVACILGQLKRCEMQLNNTSWKTLSDGCPQASLDPEAQDAWRRAVGQSKSVNRRATN